VSEWQTDEDITAAKLNQKEVYIGSSAPSSPTEGQLWYDTVNKILKVYHTEDSSWKTVITNITQIAGRSHADLQNIGANDHHTAFTPAQHDSRDHSIVADSIALSELGSRKHSELTDIGENDHHSKIHGHSEHSFGEAEVVANKEAANGYAPLDSDKLLPKRVFRVKPSDTQQFNNSTERSTSATSATKIKEIKVNKELRGSIRIKFDIARGGTSGLAHAQIYKNGSPIGTEQVSSGGYTTKSEDFNGPFEVNDLIQLYAWVSGGASSVSCKNFALCYDLDLLNADFTSQDP